MSCERSFQQRAIAMLPRFVFVLLLIQPLLDVLSYWMDVSGMPNTLTLALRFAMLALILLVGFTVSQRRWVYWTAAGILLALTGGHVYACIQAGYDNPIQDLANMLRIYQFPLVCICFISFLRANKDVYPAIRKGFCCALGIIALVELLSLITDTNPYTYANKSLGLLGWFYLPSAQSAILSALVPVVLVCAIQRWKNRNLRLCLAILGCLGILYFFGTRLSYLALFATGIGLVITLLITDRSQKRVMALLLACTLLFLAAFPVSPMYRNQVLVGQNAVKKQERIDTLVAQDQQRALDAGLSQEQVALARLSGAYEYYLGGLVHRYGLERTAQRYSYSDRASDLADTRRMRISYCAMMLEDAPFSSRLFGLELGDLTYEGAIYDAENDLHGIYYLCGSVGLGLMFLFLLYFVSLVIRALLRSWKRYFTLESAGWGIAFLTCLTHIYATAGVLRRPNVSIYLSAILACIYFIVKQPDLSRPSPKGTSNYE
ncbi:MAG: O-antigen ligase family protein [Faecousia sp.]